MIYQRSTALASDKAHAHRYLEGRESHVWRHYAATGDDDFSKRIMTSKNVRTRCVIQRAALHDAPCRSFPDLTQIQKKNQKKQNQTKTHQKKNTTQRHTRQKKGNGKEVSKQYRQASRKYRV